MKAHLRSLLLRQRGIPHFRPQVESMLEKLTDQEAEALFRLLQNLEADAKRDGKRAQARQPWKRP